MEFIVASGWVTLVGLLLLARKHQCELTADIKSRAMMVASLLVAAPLVQSIGMLAEERSVVVVFLLLGYGVASVAWLFIVLGLLGDPLASSPGYKPSLGKVDATCTDSPPEPGSVENGREHDGSS